MTYDERKLMFEKCDDYFIQKLPNNCDVDSEISFHKHIANDGKNEIVKLDLKYEVINIDDDKFMKAYVDSIDNLDIHVIIKPLKLKPWNE